MGKRLILSVLSLTLISCQSPVIQTNNILDKSTNVQTFKVSEKSGASLLFKIRTTHPLTPSLNLERGNNDIIPNLNPPFAKGVRGISSSPLFAKRGAGGEFSSKANANGIAVKTVSDIKSLRVYLLRTNTSTIVLGSDPLDANNIVYQGVVNVSPTSEIEVNFTNVTGSTDTFGTGNYYHIAVRAFDAVSAGGNEIILDNNGTGTAWTGATATTPKTAVSVSGLQVRNSDFNVSQTNNLDIIVNLQGKLPTNDAFIKITDGNPRRVKSYAVNFCTDPTRPDATKVLTTPFIINTDGDQLVGENFHRFELSVLKSAGTYYLTLQAYDKEFNNGTSFVRQDNLGTAYTAPDANKPIAVSSNTLTLDANLNYTFSSLTYFDVKANLSYFISTIAGSGATGVGNGGFSGDGGQANSARLDTPIGVATDLAGNIYIADAANRKIRKIDTSGVITTIAGTIQGFAGDGGQATSARLNGPYRVRPDSIGNIYIDDSNNHRIRKIDTSGIITTIAGSGASGLGNGGFSGDGGQATSARLDTPLGLALDSLGNIYVADTSNHRIRKIDTSGVITTIAGTTQGFSGDGGQATSAQLNFPAGLIVDSVGNVYIGEISNFRIRKVTASTGVISTIAGTGTLGNTGDGGQATSARLSDPRDLALDSVDNIYIADKDTTKIRKIAVSTGIIATIAGTNAGYSGDGGKATSAQLNQTFGLTLDSIGNVYIADTSNHRIRKLD